MPSINPRWLRRGRVAFTSEDSFELLLETTGPGMWVTMTERGITPARGSKQLALAHNQLLHSLNALPRTEKIADAFDVMAAALDSRISLGGPKGTYAAAVKSQLERAAKSRRSGGVAAAVASVTASATSATPASRAGSKFSVRPYDPESYWYEDDSDAALYRDFITMRENSHPVNMLIAGPSGSGKTEGVQRLGKRLGIPVHIVNCQAITTPEKWIGQMQADPERGTYFEPSQHIQWVERTHEDCEGADACIILYDEITRLRAELNNMTYSLFDTQRGLEVPQLGRRVQMDSKNMVIATANLGAAFTGTHTQDRAFRERFSITLERGFPPLAEEVKILTSAVGIDAARAEQLVKVAVQSRLLWEREEIDSPISTRTLKAWALLVAGGYSVKKAAEYTVIPLYSNDGGTASDRTRIGALIEGKVL